MAVTAFASGTQLAVIGTEHFLANINVAATFVFEITVPVAFLDGDVVELRIYKKTLATSGAVVAYFVVVYGNQSVEDVVKVSLPFSIFHTDAQAGRVSLLQRFGTGRSFDWAVLQHL